MTKFKFTQQKYNEKIATVIMECVHNYPELSFNEILKWLNIDNNVCTSEEVYNNMKHT